MFERRVEQGGQNVDGFGGGCVERFKKEKLEVQEKHKQEEAAAR